MSKTNLSWKFVLWGFALPLMSISAHAITLIQHCQAECFWSNPDSQTLVYGGKVEALSMSAAEGVKTLQGFCPSGILLKRTLRGVFVVERVESRNETQTDSHHRIGYRYSVHRQRTQTTRYQISVPELRAQFDTVEANATNACRPAKDSDFPTHSRDAEGNLILGG